METGKQEGEVGSEKITLSFQTVAIDYKTQGLSGLLTTAGSASYDLTKGQ
jgi:type VI protein secretion system component Hcp